MIPDETSDNHSQNQFKVNLRYSSCSQCRKSKKKCDQKLPKCSLCVRKGRECEYLAQDQRKPVTKDYANALLNRIDKLEEALDYYKSENERLKAEQAQSIPSLDDSTSLSLGTSTNYEHIVNNILSLNSILGENQSNDQNTNHSYPLSSSLGFALPTSTLKHSSNYSLNLKVPLFDNWGFSFVGKGAPLFSGYTSMRYGQISGTPKPIYNTTTSSTTKRLLKQSSNNGSLGSFYKEIFDWFFEIMDNSLPLINKELFFGSIENSLDLEALEIGEDQHASIALINAIVAYYFANHEGTGKNFEYFYKLAHEQVNEETSYCPQVKSIQTLLLLSVIDMTTGNEIRSSESVARAVAISYHLGLHIDGKNLSAQNGLSDEEILQRDLVFWCSFIIDKLRGSIMGISPFIHCPDLSIKLPDPLQFSSEAEKLKIGILSETITFADIQCETLNQFAFSLRDLFFAEEKSEDIECVKLGLAVSKASISLTEWRKNVPTNARYSNTKIISAAYLEVLFHTSTIVIHKQLVKKPLSKQELGAQAQTPIAICTKSAETILRICEAQDDLSMSFFGFHFVYAVYMASVIFLFNTSSTNRDIEVIQRGYLQKAVALLEISKIKIPVSDMYLCHLEKFHDQWLHPNASETSKSSEDMNSGGSAESLSTSPGSFLPTTTRGGFILEGESFSSPGNVEAFGIPTVAESFNSLNVEGFN